MSVQNQTVKNVYQGNGSTTVFPFTFALNEDDGEYVGVYVTNEEGVSELTTNYTINTTAKTVTYPTTGDPLEEGKKITIKRELPNEQNLNLENLGPFFADDVEDEMDREVMMIQQLAEEVGRAVKVDVAEDYPSDDVIYDIGHIKEYKTEAQTASSNAAGSEAAAALSETNAASSAAAAAVSETNAAASETNAAASAAAALASQTAAANSATQSANSATQSANSATASANSAAQSANSATASSVSAAQAATNASTSTAAAGVVQNLYPQILTAATNTGTNAAAAQAAATSAQASAATATTKAELATDAADDAADSAAAAAASATAAANSAGAAATSATEAAAANTEAKYYAKITMDKVAEAAVGFPTQEGTLTYDGTEQEPTWDIFFEAQKLTVSGTLAATNAGTYTVTMTPKPTYYWWDTGTTETRTQTWTIGRAAIEDIPSQASALVFDGTVQSPTWDDYDPTELTIGGTTSATEAGTYTATFTPTANYQWSDTTITAKSVTWEISSATVAVPTVTNTNKTYNGSAQSPTISTYDPLLIEVTGDTQTDAGSYNVVFHLKSASLTWTDTTTADKTAAWSISPKSVTVPLVSGTSFTYDGTAQGPTIASYDPDEVTASGDITATNAGNYALTLSLTSITNYVWADTTTAAKVTAWTISKAAGSLSISPTTISLDTSTLTDTITVTRTGDGAISAVSSDASIATVSLSGNTITVTAVATGNVTVTVSVAAGTNWLAPTDATASVAVQLRKLLDQCTPAEIQEIVNEGTAAVNWDIGDKTAAITLSGNVSDGLTLSNYTCHAVLIGLDHNKDLETDGKSSAHFILGKDTSNKDITFCDFKGTNWSAKSSGMWFNHSNANSNSGGWESSNIRTNIMPKFIAAMPAAWQNVLGTVTKYTDNTGAGSDGSTNVSHVTATSDKMFLLAEFEAFGTRYDANSAEKNKQTQYAYYANGNSRIRYNHQTPSSAIFWWLRSLDIAGGSKKFCNIHTDGENTRNNANCDFGVAPGFAIVKND